MPLINIAGNRFFGVSGVALTDGGPQTFAGTGFGTNSGLNAQTMLGGIGGAIETATNNANIKTSSSGSGLLPAGWTCNTTYADTGQWVSNTRAYNHTKAIKNRFGYNVATGGSYNTGNFQFGFAYDFGSNYGACYSNWIGYLNPQSQVSGQIKFMRWVGALSGGFTDNQYPNILLNQVGFAAFNRFFNGDDQGNVSVSGTIWDFNGWVRYEVMFVPGNGTANGSLQWRMTRLSDNTVLSSGSSSSIQFFATAAGETGFRWVVPQGYIGGSQSGTSGLQADGVEWYYDQDMYHCADLSGTTTPKFLYLGNNATFSSCSRLAIQRPTAWSNTSITVTNTNLGGFGSGTSLWWHVMDAINTPNQAGIFAGTTP